MTGFLGIRRLLHVCLNSGIISGPLCLPLCCLPLAVESCPLLFFVDVRSVYWRKPSWRAADYGLTCLTGVGCILGVFPPVFWSTWESERARIVRFGLAANIEHKCHSSLSLAGDDSFLLKLHQCCMFCFTSCVGGSSIH